MQALNAPRGNARPRPNGLGQESRCPTPPRCPWFSRLKREYEAGNLPAKQYLVLCELGRFDGCRFGIFPSHKTLAARARCSVRTVQNALQAARRLGLVGIGPPPASEPPGVLCVALIAMS
jgi:hypothetical protein